MSLRIKYSDSAGGKAGKGHNKTRSIQVIDEMQYGYIVKKQFSYKVGNKLSEALAIKKANQFIKNYKGD